MASEPADLRLIEPHPVDDLMPSPLGWEVWCGIGAVLLLAVLLIVWLIRRSGKSSKDSPEDIRAAAHREALAKLARCPKEDRTQTATECSTILRRYLIEVTGDRALYETHEEWVARRHSIESLGESLQQQVETLCTQLAHAKYTPADATGDAGEMIENTRDLIEAIHREVTP